MTDTKHEAAAIAELADRVEAAIWPQNDRILNREVARAVGWGYRTPSEHGRKNPAWFHPDDCRDGRPVMDSLHGTDVWREPLDYLGSLDAAMTLVPDGWSLGQWTIIGKPDSARIWRDGCDVLARGATPALALTAAALRARTLLHSTDEKDVV